MAMRNIGNLYEGGSGIPQDHGQAMIWYRKAADAGDAGAMTNIALLYEFGQGVPKDLGQAMNWRRKAAAAGDEASKQWLAAHGK